MKRSKVWILVLVTLLCLSMLPVSFSAAEGAPLEGEITFWHSFTQGPRMERIQAAADAFMADNPGVKINIETFSWADFYTKWTTGLASGNVPDMSTAQNPQVVEMIDADAIIPLDNLIDKIGRDRFYEAPLQEMTVNGSCYAVPIYLHAFVMWYRPDLLEKYGLEVPATWDELVDAIAKVKAAGYEGITMPYFFPSYYMYPFFYQAGCPIVDTTGAKPVSALMTDEGKAAWKYLCDLATTYDAYPESIKDATSWDSTYAPFMQGEVAFLFCGDWAYWSVEFNSEVDYGIAPMPAGKEAATLLGGYTLSINSNTKNYDAAWAYIQWLTAAEQSNVLESYGRISARIDTDTTELVKNYPHEATFIAQRESTMSRPSIINQSELDEMVSNAYKEVFLGTKDADTALADLDAKVSTFLHGLYS